MQDLSTFSDAAILETTEKLVKTERETTNQILHYLLENERRRIFAKEGFGSLFEYCVNRLGYSESGASRRIHSMRLLRSLGTEKAKEIEKKIESGKLSLSVVAQAATFILREAKNAPGKWDSSQKEALLSSLEGHSARETERKLLSLASEKTLQVQLEKLRPVSENLTELKVTLNSETLAALEKLKGLLSHKNPNLSWSELIEILADIALKKLDPAKEVRSRKSPEKFSEKSPKNSKENSENSLQTPTLKVTERNVVPATL